MAETTRRRGILAGSFSPAWRTVVGMDAPFPGEYRTPPFALNAEWIVEEADLRAAARALPGSRLALLRWPVAFLIAYVGVGLADARVGAAFALGSALVICGGWIILLLGSRGTNVRRVARLPRQQRTTRISIDGDRLRHEAASGRAGEYPLTEVTHAKMCGAGVLLRVSGQVLFVPRRAMQGTEQAWQDFAARLPSRRWPTGLGFTLGLWAFAVAVGVYGFLK